MAKIKFSRLILQLVLWPFIWLLISYIMTSGLEPTSFLLRRNTDTIVGMVIILLINLGFLLPNFYFRKKVVQYWVLCIFSIGLLLVLLNHPFFPWTEWLDFRPKEMRINRPDFPNFRRRNIVPMQYVRQVLPYILVLMGSTLVEVTRYANLKEKHAISLEKEKLATEIKFLKSQVNPHFLFNALHNIYTLSVIKSDMAPDSLLKLSEMLRYMIYDANENLVPLKREISYIKNYVSLQELKDSKGMNIKLKLDESRPELLVPPLIFIPFIENAFKHSRIEDREKGYIDLELETSSQSVTLTVKNSLPDIQFTKDEVGGVGLVNVKKRLKLMFPDRHLLNIISSSSEYKVYLKIDLK